MYKLIDSNNKEYLSGNKGTLGGNKSLKIYGRLDCPSALRWLSKGKYKNNRVFFKDEETALLAGYRPCGICLKDKYLAWKNKNEIYTI